MKERSVPTVTVSGLDWDCRKVRREYKAVPDAVFVARQGALLRSFLDRKNIYYLRYFRDRYEGQARANISQLLKKLPEIVHLQL